MGCTAADLWLKGWHPHRELQQMEYMDHIKDEDGLRTATVDYLGALASMPFKFPAEFPALEPVQRQFLERALVKDPTQRACVGELLALEGFAPRRAWLAAQRAAAGGGGGEAGESAPPVEWFPWGHAIVALNLFPEAPEWATQQLGQGAVQQQPGPQLLGGLAGCKSWFLPPAKPGSSLDADALGSAESEVRKC
jgi:hypothetical protein